MTYEGGKEKYLSLLGLSRARRSCHRAVALTLSAFEPPCPARPAEKLESPSRWPSSIAVALIGGLRAANILVGVGGQPSLQPLPSICSMKI